jgi:hypothetical protein
MLTTTTTAFTATIMGATTVATMEGTAVTTHTDTVAGITMVVIGMATITMGVGIRATAHFSVVSPFRFPFSLFQCRDFSIRDYAVIFVVTQSVEFRVSSSIVLVLALAIDSLDRPSTHAQAFESGINGPYHLILWNTGS